MAEILPYSIETWNFIEGGRDESILAGAILGLCVRLLCPCLCPCLLGPCPVRLPTPDISQRYEAAKASCSCRSGQLRCAARCMTTNRDELFYVYGLAVVCERQTLAVWLLSFELIVGAV